jgi:protein YIPF6
MINSNYGDGGNGPAWADPSNRPVSIEEHEEALFREYSTLDEPVYDTIMRDVNAVSAKLKIVLSPLDRNALFHSFYYAAGYSGVSQQVNDGNSSSSSNSNNATTSSMTGPNQQQHQQQPPSTAGSFPLSEQDKQTIRQLKDWDLWGPLFVCLLLAIVLSIKAPTDQASLVFAAVFCTVWIGSTVVTINAQLLGGTVSFFQAVCVLGYCIFPLTVSALIIGCLKLIINTWFWINFLVVAVGFIWSTRVSAIFIGLYIKPSRRFLALYPVFFFYTFLSWMILLF